MRISKLLSAVCAMAFLAGSPAVRAQDTPAQAAARAALMDKMSELGAQPPQATNTVAAEPAVAPKPVAPAAKESAPTVEPTPKTTGDDVVMTPINKPVSKADKAAAAAKAKADAQQAAAELKAKKEAEAAAKAQARAQTATPPPGKSDLFSPVPPPSHPEALINAPVVSPQNAPEMNPPPVTAPTETVVAAPPKPAKKVATKPAKPAKPVAEKKKREKAAPETKPVATPASANYPGRELGMKQIEAPSVPVTAEQEAELQALLKRYMADQVTPDQYQVERAKILNQP